MKFINKSSAIGFAIAAAVLWFGVISPAARPAMFLDPHAIILVLGGTLAAALIAFPGRQLFSLLDMLFLATLFPKRKDPVAVAGEILFGANLVASKRAGLVRFQPSHGFLREAFQLATVSNLDDKQLEKVLRKRASTYKKRYQMDYKVLNALAKFPPAFGLLGASTGMIEMMSNLGSGGTDSIGSAMAIALVATFWGIAIANLVLLPLADHANKLAQDDQGLRDLIIDGVVALRRGDSMEMMVEILRSHLPFDKRRQLTAGGVPVKAFSSDNEVTKAG